MSRERIGHETASVNMIKYLHSSVPTGYLTVWVHVWKHGENDQIPGNTTGKNLDGTSINISRRSTVTIPTNIDAVFVHSQYISHRSPPTWSWYCRLLYLHVVVRMLSDDLHRCVRLYAQLLQEIMVQRHDDMPEWYGEHNTGQKKLPAR